MKMHRNEKPAAAPLVAAKSFGGARALFFAVIAGALLGVFPFGKISPSAAAQSGVLIAVPGEKPDPKKLSLAEMSVDILIDNRHATVKVRQIFENRTPQTLEGKYLFALRPDALISDFAVWDADLRIPGVIMEKRRANRVYGEIKQNLIDPGILQTTDETESAAGFSAKIFPIAPHGTKRLEMEYTEDVPVENLASRLTFPLRPSYGESQKAGEFSLRIRVLSEQPIAPILPANAAYPLVIVKNEPHEFVGEFRARDFELAHDFAFDYRLETAENTLSVIAYRAPERISAYDLRDPRAAENAPDGYFLAEALFARAPDERRAPKRVVLLVDTSLSMYGDKLRRAVEAVDYFLHNLAPEDEFNLVLFNDEALELSAVPLKGGAETAARGLAFVKNSFLGGGTNLQKALDKAIAAANRFADGERQIVLVSDAVPTLGTTRTAEIEKAFDDPRLKFHAFAFGADAGAPLLRRLTEKTRGALETARETEDAAVKLKLFFDRIGRPSLAPLRLDAASPGNLYDVYATKENAFYGSGAGFVGRYRQPRAERFSLTARDGADLIGLAGEFVLPQADETHSFLPRLWARARVDALLRMMNRDGESEEAIDEIVRLSEKYKFVTPYTAFLAAPRALLRPRLIQPGDPVIRVKTDPSIVKVFAVLPFGETLPLKYLPAEGVWQTRFLAPVWMNDGTYRCRLLLTDEAGRGYQEEKTFVVDSRAPKLRITLGKRIFRAGEEIAVKVAADSDTVRLSARLYGAEAVPLVWSDREKTNAGRLVVPPDLAAGKYALTVTAEDSAHNQTFEETTIEVIGR